MNRSIKHYFHHVSHHFYWFLFTGAVRQIFAVVHGTALLPCDIAPPIPHDPQDTVILVVWYRYEKTAIYR